MKKSLLIILSLSLVLSACSNDKDNEKGNIISSEPLATESEVKENKEGDKEKFEVTFYDFFDTVTTFTAYTENEEEFNKYKQLVEDKMEYYHKLFNSYNEYKDVNNFYTINQMAGKKPVKVEQPVIDLVKIGQEWYDETDGKIDIAAGSLLKIWTDFRNNANADPDNAKLPSKSELEEASKHMNMDAIEVNEDDSTVYINDKDVQIDVGAIGKGYATELIKRELIRAGLENGILSVGGDVAIIGDNPVKENRNYAIAVLSPDTKIDNSYASIVYVTNTSVVTSGDYQRYFEIDGRKYHHIIDVETLEPSTKYKSITVVLDDIGEADAISTALFVMDIDEGKEFAEKHGAEVFWIDAAGNEYKTDGYEKIEEK